MFDIGKLGKGDFQENRPLGTLLRADEVDTVTGTENRTADDQEERDDEGEQDEGPDSGRNQGGRTP